MATRITPAFWMLASASACAGRPGSNAATALAAMTAWKKKRREMGREAWRAVMRVIQKLLRIQTWRRGETKPVRTACARAQGGVQAAARSDRCRCGARPTTGARAWPLRWRRHRPRQWPARWRCARARGDRLHRCGQRAGAGCGRWRVPTGPPSPSTPGCQTAARAAGGSADPPLPRSANHCAPARGPIAAATIADGAGRRHACARRPAPSSRAPARGATQSTDAATACPAPAWQTADACARHSPLPRQTSGRAPPRHDWGGCPPGPAFRAPSAPRATTRGSRPAFPPAHAAAAGGCHWGTRHSECVAGVLARRRMECCAWAGIGERHGRGLTGRPRLMRVLCHAA
ncbi:hypothetical protein COLO4_02394 [Corchorus olitorius]|uniref:Uncharacterized protein n=1 Tax=Corchorus olitorius TaxID=93759 RepID=A0A1R3L127_9ROSI|nr:hypothetical protein COLO4_02394 [Corchorus olitorius]